jgi:large subunit ribosomal protein L4
MKLDVTTLDAEKAGFVELSEAMFGLKPRADILHRMVMYQLAKRQSGTHASKNRSQIAGTSKRVGRQKGGGTARHGNRKAPIFRGGGKSFGPAPRSHAIKLPKKIRSLSLLHALSAKAGANELVVVEDLGLDAPKTSMLKRQLDKLCFLGIQSCDGGEVNDNFSLAARNIPNIDVLPVQGINVYDILRREKLVLSKAALEALEARFK